MKSYGTTTIDSRRFFHQTQMLRNELSHFVETVQHYTMSEVLETNWVHLLSNVSKVNNLDSLIEAHQGFLNSIKKRSLLSTEILRKTATEIFDLIQKFGKFQQKYTASVLIELNKQKEQKQAQLQQLQSTQSQAKKRTTRRTTSQTQTQSTTSLSNIKTEWSVSALTLIQNAAKEVFAFTGEYRKLVKLICNELKAQRGEEPLRLLAEKLNFNGFYY